MGPTEERAAIELPAKIVSLIRELGRRTIIGVSCELLPDRLILVGPSFNQAPQSKHLISPYVHLRLGLLRRFASALLIQRTEALD